MPKHSGLTPEQRAAVVLAHLRREETNAALCRRYGISEATLTRWRDEFLAGGQAALGAGKLIQNEQARRIERLETELGKRDQIIGELTVANRILKKTAAPD